MVPSIFEGSRVKVHGWMEMVLSTGEKEVLIKSVAQAVSTYSMSCFKLPRGLCEHINGILQIFWWGSKEGKRKTCWVAWDEMIKPSTCVAWDSKILSFSICLCWLGKLGEC